MFFKSSYYYGLYKLKMFSISFCLFFNKIVYKMRTKSLKLYDFHKVLKAIELN